MTTEREPADGWRLLRSALGNAPFRRYFIVDNVSALGAQMQFAAVGWLAAGLSGKAEVLGWLAFAQNGTMLALLMLGGWLADHRDQRHLVLFFEGGVMAIALALGGLVASGHLAIWHLAVAGVLGGLVSALGQPATTAIYPRLAPADHIAAALALDRLGFNLARVLGPALAGWVLAGGGSGWPFYANALTCLPALLVVWALPPLRPQSAGGRSWKDGARWLLGDATGLRMALLLSVATLCVSPPLFVLLPLYARQTLALAPGSYGLLAAAVGLGALAGATVQAMTRRAWRPAVMRGGVLVAATGLVTLALATAFTTAWIGALLVTLGAAAVFGLANAAVHERVPEALRGRVSAVLALTYYGVMPLAGVLASQAAGRWGLRAEILAAAALYVPASLLLLRRSR